MGGKAGEGRVCEREGVWSGARGCVRHIEPHCRVQGARARGRGAGARGAGARGAGCGGLIHTCPERSPVAYPCQAALAPSAVAFGRLSLPGSCHPTAPRHSVSPAVVTLGSKAFLLGGTHDCSAIVPPATISNAAFKPPLILFSSRCWFASLAPGWFPSPVHFIYIIRASA